MPVLSALGAVSCIKRARSQSKHVPYIVSPRDEVKCPHVKLPLARTPAHRRRCNAFCIFLPSETDFLAQEEDEADPQEAAYCKQM